MEAQVITPDAIREMPHTQATHATEATFFLGRYPARVRRIQARVDADRARLNLALALFRAELVAQAA